MTLTMLLTPMDIHPQSYIALSVLNVLLQAGSLYFLSSAVRWMGFPVPRALVAWTVVLLIYQLWNGSIV